MSDKVWIEHPDLPDSKVEVTKQQFELIWSNSGWKRVRKPSKAELEEMAEAEVAAETAAVLED